MCSSLTARATTAASTATLRLKENGRERIATSSEQGHEATFSPAGAESRRVRPQAPWKRATERSEALGESQMALFFLSPLKVKPSMGAPCAHWLRNDRFFGAVDNLSLRGAQRRGNPHPSPRPQAHRALPCHCEAPTGPWQSVSFPAPAGAQGSALSLRGAQRRGNPHPSRARRRNPHPHN